MKCKCYQDSAAPKQITSRLYFMPFFYHFIADFQEIKQKYSMQNKVTQAYIFVCFWIEEIKKMIIKL